MKLKEWAVAQGVHSQMACAWFHAGVLRVRAEWVGAWTILVFEDLVEVLPSQVVGGLGLYSRVSSRDQKADLVRQAECLRVWASVAGVPVIADVLEVGSGMNGSRPKLRKLLANPDVTTIVVEHRDRLGRMNTELVESALTASGRRLVVVDAAELDDDLVRDVTGVLISFCARLYGCRSAANRSAAALIAAENPVVDSAGTGSGG